MTFDNGKKFTQYERINQQNIDVYFAYAYSSNQRERNENSNGLIRQYLPKCTEIYKLTSQQTNKIAYDLTPPPENH